MRLTTILLAAAVAIGAAADRARKPNDHESELLHRIVAGWEWKQYWTGHADWRIRPGMRDEVYLVEGPNLLMLCSKEMHEVWLYETTEGRLRELGASRLTGAGKFQEQCGSAQIAFSRLPDSAGDMQPVLSKIRSILSSGRPSVGQGSKPGQDAVADPEWSLLTLQWPTIQVPDGQQLDQPGAAELIQSIRERMDVVAQCKPTAEIPKYGKYTPSVFVLFIEGDCSKHILEFVRDGDGEWTTVAKYTSEVSWTPTFEMLRALRWKTIE